MKTRTEWEEIFRTWSKPPSETEQDRCDNAEKMIREAIRNDPVLSKKEITVFVQGSYKHNTNIKLDSDVDICVCYMNTFYYDLPDDSKDNPERFGIIPSSYTLTEFKKSVENALVAKFGRNAVKRGNKAFDIHENTYRVSADVVPCFEHRRYTGNFINGKAKYLSGTELLPDNGSLIINWPNQDYENGVRKNNQTGNRYKYLVRILKRMRNELQDKKFTAANNIASFLIESLVWNVPNEGFNSTNYVDNVRYVLAHTANETSTVDKCFEWGEVNELKYLFRSAQPWTRDQANKFLNAAWDYIGFA